MGALLWRNQALKGRKLLCCLEAARRKTTIGSWRSRDGSFSGDQAQNGHKTMLLLKFSSQQCGEEQRLVRLHRLSK